MDSSNSQYPRTALVTGAATGIGRAIADKLSVEGFRIVIVYKSSESAAMELAAQLNSRGVFCMAVRCDITDSIAVEGLYRRVTGTFGFIDTLINNAGGALYKQLCDCRDADFNAMIDVNYRGAFNCCRAFYRDMAANGFGRIVNISSVWGRMGASMETLYSGAKAALLGFTRALSQELAPSGVTVNSVSPGLIDTAMTAGITDEGRAAFLARVPLGRIGTPNEVADVVELLTRKNLYITGADIPVDGGFCC